MTIPRYIRTPDGRLVAVPTPISPPKVEPVEEREEPEEKAVETREEPRAREEGEDELSEVFEVTEEDVLGKPEDNIPQELTEEDEEYLFGVSEPDAVEEPPKPKRKLFRRTRRPYSPPSQSIIGPR